MKKTILLSIIVYCLILQTGMATPIKSKTKNANSVTLHFNNLFGNEPLVFKKEYINAFGEKLTFSTLNYFISNIKLTKKDGAEYIVPQDSSYFLVKQPDSLSHTIVLKNVPKGKYNNITFTIGVDSARNTYDVSKRTGVLDIGAGAKGMYWVWNSGYIFFKLEGKTVNEVDSLRKGFHYHIGGYGGFDTKTINNIKVKSLTLPNVAVSKRKNPVINVQVDIAKVFDNIHPLKIAEHPGVMWGDWSVKIADNYFSIFSLGDINYRHE